MNSPHPDPLQLRAPRVLLYSHDSYGLGHLRRTLTLAQELVRVRPGASVLIATGSPCATRFTMPPGVDLVKLPSVGKNAEGEYVSRNLRQSFKSLIELRSRLLTELFAAFRPDLLIVDHKPLGLGGELEPILRRAPQLGTRTVLGIRDIIDEPEVVAAEWGKPDVRWALSEAYDQVCVYGSPQVFDVRSEYPVPPELVERVRFMGYVVRPSSPATLRPLPAFRPRILVTAGGGEDGEQRVETYLEALRLDPKSAERWDSVIVLGPLLDPIRARRLKRMARSMPSVHVHSFYEDMPRLFSEASAVVAMAGYNTVAEILRSGTPSVLLPRVFPRKEQLIRAERLAALGLARCLPEPTPETLRTAVEGALRDEFPAQSVPPLQGAQETCRLALAMLDESDRRSEAMSV